MRSVKQNYRDLKIIVYSRIGPDNRKIYAFQVTERAGKNTKTLYGSKKSEDTFYLFQALLNAYRRADKIIQHRLEKEGKKKFNVDEYPRRDRIQEFNCVECGRFVEDVRGRYCEDCRENPIIK